MQNSENGTSKNQRKVLLIMPDFQIRVLKQLLILSISICVTVFTSNYAFVHHWKTRALEVGLDPNHVFFQFLKEIENGMILVFAMTSVISTILVIGLGLVFSHRVAGPIKNISDYFGQLKTKGWTGPIKLRKDDYFHSLASEINDSLEVVVNKKQDAKK